MKAAGMESPQRISSRAQSRSSSKLKLNASATGKTRKIAGKSLTSALLQQRQGLRLIKDDVDVTPKSLSHHAFAAIDERQMTAFEMIGLSQSNAQLGILSSGFSSLRISSSLIVKSASVPSSGLPTDDTPVESLLTTQALDFSVDDEDRAPSQFYLPSSDSGVFHVRPETVTITLRETETFFVFEMLQLTGDLQTPEGVAIKEENEKYEYVTVGPGSNRKLADAETQTIRALTKSRGTYLGRKSRQNRGVFVNNWVMYDTYGAPELMTEVNGRLVVHTKESLQRMLEAQELQHKLPKSEVHSESSSLEAQLAYIYEKTCFRDAARTMERIIANNTFVGVQKRFKGLIKQDPCSLDLEFTYSLDLLWTQTCDLSRGRPVSSFRWNPVNTNVLAVAYGARPNSDVKDGLLLIWCAKNPRQPDRWYNFDSPISDIDWSRDRPNLLAVGSYNGAVKVIDVSRKDINVIRQNRGVALPSSSPHWQVQWWPGDEQFDYQEQIYTSNQNGCVFRYRTGEDFSATEIMRIYRIQGKIAGVGRIDHCVVYDIPISRHPGILILRKHPTSSNMYFVGSDEGCLYRCSTNYLYHYVDCFLAHDGPLYSMEFSPFCSKIFLTCGADWCTRVWADGLTEPLITLSTSMACVRCATWCPTYSTIIVSIVNNEICIWDIKRKTYTPTSITISPNSARFVMVDFTRNGNQLVVADVEGVVYVYNLEGMPFPPYNQKQVLVESIEKALITKPVLLRKLKKLGPLY